MPRVSSKWSKKRGRKAWTNPKSQKTLFANLRKATLKMQETKFFDNGAENVNLYHNVGHSSAYAGATNPYVTYVNLLGLEQGSTATRRIGDKVWSVGLSISLWLSQKADRPNVSYRVLVLQYPDMVYGATYTGINQKVFYPAAMTNYMLEKVDTDMYNVVYDKIIQPINQSGKSAEDFEHSHIHKFYLRTGREITYRSNTNDVATTIPKDMRNRYCMYVLPYDHYGTLVSDNIASVSYTFRHYFKDP